MGRMICLPLAWSDRLLSLHGITHYAVPVGAIRWNGNCFATGGPGCQTSGGAPM